MFIGHEKNWDFLLKEKELNRLPPVYLFYGSDGIGKKKVAEAFVKNLFCAELKIKNSLGCGSCTPCLQVSKQNHPDYFLIKPEKKSIQIDTLRFLRAQLERVSHSAPYKIAIIDNAHEMTLGAANSLLKTLEEPPKNTLILLITSSLFRILPTIRSRCRLLFFSPPPIAKLAHQLSQEWGMEEGVLKKLLDITEGSPGMAREISDDAFKEAMASWEHLAHSSRPGFRNLSLLAQNWVKQEVDLIPLLEMIKKNIFQGMVSKESWKDLDRIDQIQQAQKDIQNNVNKTLVLENLFLQII